MGGRVLKEDFLMVEWIGVKGRGGQEPISKTWYFLISAHVYYEHVQVSLPLIPLLLLLHRKEHAMIKLKRSKDTLTARSHILMVQTASTNQLDSSSSDIVA